MWWSNGLWPAGQDEPVTAQPQRVGRVVTHHVLEEQVGQRGKADRGARVAVAGLLDGVGGKQSGRVHGPHIQVGPAGEGGHRGGQRPVAAPAPVGAYGILVTVGGALVSHEASLS